MRYGTIGGVDFNVVLEDGKVSLTRRSWTTKRCKP